MSNKNLEKAKQSKNDEFYTQITDIEKELEHYKEQLKGKSIYCNCDNENSNFWKYFLDNFEELEIKKVSATGFDSKTKAIKLEYEGKEIIRTELKENGDFGSDECLEILKESDIICTNPPFSLFRAYIEVLYKHDKKFLIIGNYGAITYKEIFKLIQDNRIWLGYNPRGMKFMTSDGSIKEVNATWFTNLEITKIYEDLIMYKEYTSEMYPKYDNYDVINVNKVSDIPVDYFGVIGVPITFMEKCNSKQFEILGIARNTGWIGYECLTIINGVNKYFRILIRRKREEA